MQINALISQVSAYSSLLQLEVRSARLQNPAQVKKERQRLDVLSHVQDTFQEELAARQTTGTLLQHERWNEEGVNLIGPL